MAEETMKTRSIRATDEAFNALKEMAESGEFANQGEAFTALIRLWESEQAKQLIPGRETEIEDFRMHINSLGDIYLKSLQLNVDTEARIRDEYSARMQGQDLTIANLHEQLQTGQDLVSDYQNQLAAKKAEMEQMTDNSIRVTKELEAVKTSLADKIEEQKALNAAIRRLTQADEEKAAEISTMKEKVAHIADLEQKVIDLTTANREQAAELEKLRKDKAAMDVTQAEANNLRKQVGELTSHIHDAEMEHRNALEALRIEKDKAVLAEQQEKQERYGTLQDKYDALMEKYSVAVGSSKQQSVKKLPRPFQKNGETKNKE